MAHEKRLRVLTLFSLKMGRIVSPEVVRQLD